MVSRGVRAEEGAGRGEALGSSVFEMAQGGEHIRCFENPETSFLALGSAINGQNEVFLHYKNVLVQIV